VTDTLAGRLWWTLLDLAGVVFLAVLAAWVRGGRGAG
jgi:hypothetical protein